MSKIRFEDLEPVSATDAKIRFGEILHQTAVNGKKFIVDRHGKPLSVILSYREYKELFEREKGDRDRQE